MHFLVCLSYAGSQRAWRLYPGLRRTGQGNGVPTHNTQWTRNASQPINACLWTGGGNWNKQRKAWGESANSLYTQDAKQDSNPNPGGVSEIVSYITRNILCTNSLTALFTRCIVKELTFKTSHIRPR